MKLANHLSFRLSGILILVLLLWAIAYFILQMNEIYDGVDEGLSNLNQEFVHEANKSADFIESIAIHDPLNIIIDEISEEQAINTREEYITTTIYFETEEEYEEVRMFVTAFYCEANNKYYSLKFFTSTVESDDLVKSMLYLLIALWVGLSLTILIATKRIISRSAKPFHKTLNNLKKFRLDKRQMIEFPKSNIDEYKELNESLNELLTENIKVFTEQKNFIENASHELQTPLAISISKLEMLMNDPTLKQEQLEATNTIVQSMNRMKRMNSSLLLLSKINNKQYNESEQIDLGIICDEIVDNFIDLAEHKGITINITKQEDLFVFMNIELAHILITNLVKNAITHNIPEGGTVDILLTKDKFEISNTGKLIKEDINIFDRYTSKSIDNSSSGLGLAIVKSITDLYHFSISHTYHTKHIITIRIPEMH